MQAIPHIGIRNLRSGHYARFSRSFHNWFKNDSPIHHPDCVISLLVVRITRDHLQKQIMSFLRRLGRVAIFASPKIAVWFWDHDLGLAHIDKLPGETEVSFRWQPLCTQQSVS